MSWCDTLQLTGSPPVRRAATYVVPDKFASGWAAARGGHHAVMA